MSRTGKKEQEVEAGKAFTVVGVDPGLAQTGYGVVRRREPGKYSLLECGVLRTGAQLPLAERLRRIFDGIRDVLERHEPSALALEGVFFGRNVRTTLLLGHARGVIMLAGSLHRVTIHEYSPAQVKNAVVGKGRATKEQVQFMVQHLLRLASPPEPSDAADGVAVALCHCYSQPVTFSDSGAGGVGRVVL